VSVLPVSLIEPVWEQFSVLLPAHPVVAPAHPLGCHRRRIPDRIVFDHVVAALVHGSGYERIATPGCSDRTIRRRLQSWATVGITVDRLQGILRQYDRVIGVDLANVAVDGCITKAPCGGETAGKRPVDRGKQGLKRSVLVDGNGVPLHVVVVGANRNDGPLLAETLQGLATWGPPPGGTTIHLDRGYDSQRTRQVLADLGLQGRIAVKGVPAPVQAGMRWVVERTHAWMNGFGKLRRCTERRAGVTQFYVFLAAAIVATRCLIDAARSRYRWPTRPTTRRLK
jgi:hypothetical protein